MLNVQGVVPEKSFGSNMYIINSGNEYAVIDPSVDFLFTVQRYPEVKHATKYIIITHAHFDHILAIDSWTKGTGAEVLVGRFDGPSLSDPDKNAYRLFFGMDRGYSGRYTELDDGDELMLGGERFKVIATPGHTPGGISLAFKDAIFVGDTVFADGGYGRCDLPGGDFDTLVYSIRRLSELSPTLTVYPGHGRATQIGEIKSYFCNFLR